MVLEQLSSLTAFLVHGFKVLSRPQRSIQTGAYLGRAPCRTSESSPRGVGSRSYEGSCGNAHGRQRRDLARDSALPVRYW